MADPYATARILQFQECLPDGGTQVKWERVWRQDGAPYTLTSLNEVVRNKTKTSDPAVTFSLEFVGARGGDSLALESELHVEAMNFRLFQSARTDVSVVRFTVVEPAQAVEDVSSRVSPAREVQRPEIVVDADDRDDNGKRERLREMRVYDYDRSWMSSDTDPGSGSVSDSDSVVASSIISVELKPLSYQLPEFAHSPGKPIRSKWLSSPLKKSTRPRKSNKKAHTRQADDADDSPKPYRLAIPATPAPSSLGAPSPVKTTGTISDFSVSGSVDPAPLDLSSSKKPPKPAAKRKTLDAVTNEDATGTSLKPTPKAAKRPRASTSGTPQAERLTHYVGEDGVPIKRGPGRPKKNVLYVTAEEAERIEQVGREQVMIERHLKRMKATAQRMSMRREILLRSVILPHLLCLMTEHDLSLLTPSTLATLSLVSKDILSLAGPALYANPHLTTFKQWKSIFGYETPPSLSPFMGRTHIRTVTLQPPTSIFSLASPQALSLHSNHAFSAPLLSKIRVHIPSPNQTHPNLWDPLRQMLASLERLVRGQVQVRPELRRLGQGEGGGEGKGGEGGAWIEVVCKGKTEDEKAREKIQRCMDVVWKEGEEKKKAKEKEDKGADDLAGSGGEGDGADSEVVEEVVVDDGRWAWRAVVRTEGDKAVAVEVKEDETTDEEETEEEE